MKKMLLIGPGRGHNIIPYLKAYDSQLQFKVDFLAQGLIFKASEYPNINMINIKSFKNDFFKWCKYIFFKKYDIIYVHGTNDIQIAFFFLISRAKIKIFHAWGNSLIDAALSHQCFKKNIAQIILKFSTYLLWGWHGTKERADKEFPWLKNKSLLLIENCPNFFLSSKQDSIVTPFTRKFLDSIQKERVVSIWPRTIAPCTGQLLVAQSILCIKKQRPELLENYTLYLWGGNVEDSEYRKNIQNLINDNNLEKNIIIVDHPFLSVNELKLVEQRSDFFINIAFEDQLSTFILEMLYLGKPLILSNLRPFQFLNEIYNLEIELTDNNLVSITDILINMIENKTEISQDLIEKRKKFCLDISNQEDKYREFLQLIFSKC